MLSLVSVHFAIYWIYSSVILKFLHFENLNNSKFDIMPSNKHNLPNKKIARVKLKFHEITYFSSPQTLNIGT